MAGAFIVVFVFFVVLGAAVVVALECSRTALRQEFHALACFGERQH